MPRAVWQPTSARMPAARAVASRVASITKLTAASKGKEAAPRFDPACGSCLFFLDSQQRRVSQTRRAAVPPSIGFPPQFPAGFWRQKDRPGAGNVIECTRTRAISKAVAGAFPVPTDSSVPSRTYQKWRDGATDYTLCLGCCDVHCFHLLRSVIYPGDATNR